MLPDERGALIKQANPIARALNTVAARTSRTFTMRTQAGRFRIQKTVYLLKRLDYPPARRYDFNVYHMGPYSPTLTRAYYALEDDGIRSAGAATDIPTQTLTVLDDAVPRSDAFLEGLTTLLDVRAQGVSPIAALAQAKAIKSHLSESVWREVRAFLQTHPILV